jgi:hypothetical protein
VLKELQSATGTSLGGGVPVPMDYSKSSANMASPRRRATPNSLSLNSADQFPSQCHNIGDVLDH